MMPAMPRRMALRAGDMRHSVQIQERGPGYTTEGAPVNEWVTWATVNARIVQIGGGKMYAGMQFAPETTHHVAIYWLDGVTNANMRIVTDDGRYLEIMIVNYSERRLENFVGLECKERMDWVPATD